MMRIERGDHDLADIVRNDEIAGAGLDDFEDQILVDHHAVARLGLERDEAEVRGAERLVGVDAA